MPESVPPWGKLSGDGVGSSVEPPLSASRGAFADLLRRVRAGDAQAERELWDLYYPAIHREVKARLYHRGIRRVLDSADVCQSVFGSFYLRARQGQYELGSARDLFNLLYAMARNKVLMQVARQSAACRNPDRIVPDAIDQVKLPAPDPSPSERVTVRDLAQHYLGRLPEPERRLAELYYAGNTWEEIAAQSGGQADALRIRLMRALNRIKPQADGDEGDR